MEWKSNKRDLDREKHYGIREKLSARGICKNPQK